MKSVSTIFKSFVVAIAASALLTGCIKDKFDSPAEVIDQDPNLPVNLTIEELKNLYKTEPVEITEDYIISGTVISDDQAGNVYQTLIIQDETGGVGFRIQRPDLFTDYPFGRKVYVKLKGLWVGAYNNLIQVGAGTDGAGGVTAIPAALAADYVVKGPRNQTVTPLEITIDELSSKYQNMLIKLKDVQFIAAEAGKVTYADAVNKLSVSTKLEDCNGKTIELRTSGYSKFAATVVPEGKGDIVVIYQIFRTTNQLLLNKLEDVQLTNPERCGGGPVEPVDTTAPTAPATDAKLLSVATDFEDFNAFVNNLRFAMRSYATKADGQGFGGTTGLAIKAPTGIGGTANQAVITPKANAGFILAADANRISFYVKGTAGKTLVLYVYKSDGTSFHTFNVGDLTTHKLIKPTSGSASYTGTINTNGQWALVTLDLTGLTDINRTTDGDIFALRVGHTEPYDLVIDNIVAWKK